MDFVLTHFYRLVVHDVVLLNDVYSFYCAGRTEGKTVNEFAEVNESPITLLLASILYSDGTCFIFRSCPTC
jgi:hypothetical protein